MRMTEIPNVVGHSWTGEGGESEYVHSDDWPMALMVL